MYDQYQRLAEPLIEGAQREVAERQQSIQNMADSLPKMPRQVPVTLVEHMTDPRAAQLQMLFASLDERGKKTIVAMAATMVKLHKDSEHG